MTVCIIPARGGSKRIPKKNIKNFNGKPMIQWSIEAAEESGIFDHIIVSTDDDDIAQIAERLGAWVPFRRPAELSDDYTNTTAVIAHATRWCIDRDIDTSTVCCLYATSPFVLPSDLIEAYRIIRSENWEFVFSATEYSSPIFRSFKQLECGGVEMFYPEHFETRSQDLPLALHDAGMFYMGTPGAWLSGLKMFDDHSFPLKIPGWRVQDIDTPDDWERAAWMSRAIQRT